MNEVINLMKNHRSIRKYKDQDVSEEIINKLLEAVQSMPTSINSQQLSVIVVRDKETKKKLSEYVGNQSYVYEAPVFLVFVMDLYKTYIAGEKTGNPQIIHESLEGLSTGIFDGGIALGAAVVAAESLGLGICPIGGIRRDPEKVIEILGLPKYTFPLVGLTVGYAEDKSKVKPRLPFNSFKHEETYHKDRIRPSIDKYDEEMSKYLKEIGREQIEGNWSIQTSKIYSTVYYPKVKPALENQGFKHDK